MSSLPKLEETLEKIARSLGTWKNIINEVYQDETEQRNQLSVLEKIVADYGRLEVNFENTHKALQSLDAKLDTEMKRQDVDSLYDDCVSSLEAVSDDSYKETNIWQTIFKGPSEVEEVHTKQTQIDDSKFEDLGGSLLCSNVFTPPVDPISKGVIRNPHKNKRCGHLYEYDTIAQYIRAKKRRARCPYIGCKNNSLKMTDLVKDDKMKSQIDNYLLTQDSQDSETDTE